MRLSASEFAALFPNHPENAILRKQGALKSTRRTSKRPAARSHLEALFAQQLQALRGLPPVEEHRFAPPRKWAFDFAWPDLLLAVEIEGGTYSRGRHVRPQGFQNDCEKYNEATRLGWRVLRFTAKDVKSGAAVDSVIETLAQAKTSTRHLGPSKSRQIVTS